MDIPKTFTIQFSDHQEVSLSLVEEAQGVLKYQATKYNCDLEKDEKYTLTISLELSPLKDEERKSALLYKMFYGKTIPNTEIKITNRHNGQIIQK